ncbi:mucin-16-like [Pyxicephalus adspersus]|uniref:mucin-16-like n=1 Tax=Pyxicephalus adspersus TaxID=30357 RepID=UPI003B5BB3EE
MSPIPTTIPTTPLVAISSFTVNVTITNLPYTSDMGKPNTSIFNSTQLIMNNLLDSLMNKTSLNEMYSRCKVVGFRLGNSQDTKVDAICTSTNQTPFDTVALYKELKILTSNFSKLSIYTLDPNSVYVNGYNEYTLSTTILPTTHSPSTVYPAADSSVTVNFTLTNLKFVYEFTNPASSKYISTQAIMNTLLDDLMKKTSLKMSLSACQLISLENSDGDTKVNAVCKYNSTLETSPFNTVAFYKELKNQTLNITKLAIYTLNPNSLYVNGYNEYTLSTTILPTTHSPSTVYPAADSSVTVNFTLTNLKFVNEFTNPASSKYISTQAIMNTLLDDLMKKTSLKISLSACQLISLENSDGDTKVNAVCKYNSTLETSPFNTVDFYKEIKNLTLDITKLAIYTLNPNSLYINGYNEKIQTTFTSSPATTTVMAAVSTFTVNFTVTNLAYTSDMGVSNTSTFNSTQIVFSVLLDTMMNKSSIKNHSKCKVVGLWLANSQDTKVDAVCTNTNQTPFDTLALYKEFKNLTSNFSKLSIYNLDPNSFYVNGYNEKMQTAPTTSPTANNTGTEASTFTVNLTITNLLYTSDMGKPNTVSSNSTQFIINTLLNMLISKTSQNNTSVCKAVKLSLADSRSTKIDVICTKNQTVFVPFNTISFYKELKNLTSNFTTLGIYTLDSNSFYVNGYNEKTIPTTSATPSSSIPVVNILTLNFTITNLLYTSDMGIPNTSTFNNTKFIMNTLINSVVNQTTLKLSSPACQTIGFMSANSLQTKVDAICTYASNSASPPFDTTAFYRELKNLTMNITSLGIYKLDSNSLYVNGYIEKYTAPPTLSAPTINNLTMNFTITNLKYTLDLGVLNSSKFNSTSRIITSLLSSIMKTTSLGSSYTGCQIVAFSSANSARDTKVDAVCTYINSSAAPGFDRVGFFKELANKTNGITSFGIYSLDPNSLYVNGYNEHRSVEPTIEAATKGPVETINFEEITLNVTITNLAYTSDLQLKNSSKYNSTSTNVLYLVNNLMRNSTLSFKFINCLIDSFVLNATGTKVNLVCKIKKDTTEPQFDKVAFYNEVTNMTSNITKLGIYKLDKNSLYVNGYNKATTATTTTSPFLTTLGIFGPKKFFINFTITNLDFNATLANKTSDPFKNIKGKLDNLLNNGYQKNLLVKDNFEMCAVTTLRSTPKSVDTTVEAICIFNIDLLSRVFSADDVEISLLEITQNGTLLGNFTLSRSSIHVNIYREDETSTVSSSMTTTASIIIEALPSSTLRGFNVNFTILNNSVPNDPQKRQMLEQDIVNKMNELYRNSTLSEKFKYCLLSSVRNGSIIVSCKCYFQDEPSVNSQSVETEFNQGTNKGNMLGSVYPLRNISVTEIQKDDSLPFWAIILICLGALLGLVLILILFLLIFGLKKTRKGFYNLEQSIYGTYFPHLDMRKLY